MGLYLYSGRLTNRKHADGFIAAESKGEAIEKLEKEAVVKIKLIYLGSYGGFEYKLFKPKKMKKIKKKNMAYFFKQMGFLIKSGVTTYDSIEILSVSENVPTAILCQHMKPEITQGLSFADALSNTKLIPKDIVEKVRAGETSNSMDDALKNISKKLDEEIKLASSIKAGLTYPIFSLTAVFGIAMFMLLVLVPRIAEIIGDFGAELPALTLALIACSEAVKKYWWLMLIILTVCIYIHVFLMKKRPEYKLLVHKKIYDIPILGPIAKKLNLLYLCSVLSQLMNSGKNTVDSLSLAKETVNNTYLVSILEKVEFNMIRRGMNLYEAMADYEVFPGEFLQMIKIGVRTGNISEVLDNIYNQYRYEAEDAIKAATDMIQPISLVLIGAVVGIFVLGMYSAIYCVFDAV